MWVRDIVAGGTDACPEDWAQADASSAGSGEEEEGEQASSDDSGTECEERGFRTADRVAVFKLLVEPAVVDLPGASSTSSRSNSIQTSFYESVDSLDEAEYQRLSSGAGASTSAAASQQLQLPQVRSVIAKFSNFRDPQTGEMDTFK